MVERIRYVYKIFDKLNEDKIYIGTTFHINKRWCEHKKSSNSIKLKRDMEQFGTQDFEIEIIFEGTEKEAYNREVEIIKELKPYYNNPGDIGGNTFSNDNKGEHNGYSKLTDIDVIDICKRSVILHEKLSNIQKDYTQVTRKTIRGVITGTSWEHIKEAPRCQAKDQTQELKLSNNDVLDICNRIVINKEKTTEVYKDYPQVGISYIYEIVNGNERKDVKNAPRKKATKRYTKEDVIMIRKESLKGNTPENIHKTYFSYKSLQSVRDVINKKTFSKIL